MTPRERAFWLRAQRRAAQLEPDIARALLRAFAILRESLSEAELARFIESGNVERLMQEALSQDVLDRAFIPFRQRLRQGVEQSVKYFARDLPRGGKVDGVIAVEFNVLNPRVVDAIRTLDTKVVQSLADDARAGMRATVEQGLRDGKNPRAIAKDLKQQVGLSPKQVELVAKHKAQLEATGAFSEKRLAQFEQRMLARTRETVARTAALDAMKVGQRLSWEDAIDKGIVDRNQLKKTWRGVLDNRQRPAHRAMEGQTVGFDEPFSNGEMTPGSDSYNCRCVAIYRVA